MRILEIESHMRRILPLFYDGFVTKSTAVSAVVTSNVMAIEKTLHGLTTGDEISINGAELTQSVSLISFFNDNFNNFAILETTESNDITPGFPDEITISGADAPDSGFVTWNQTFTIIEAISRTQFVVKVPGDINLTLTGTPIFIESDLARYNSLFTVTVVDADNFTVPVNESIDVTLGGTILFYPLNGEDGVRIVADVDVSFFMDTYDEAKQSNLWMVIVPDASVLSKERASKNDFLSDQEVGTAINQQEQSNISIFVFFPVVELITPVTRSDLARNDLKVALINTILGYVPSRLFNEGYSPIYFTGDNVESLDPDNHAVYVHRYDFATNTRISEADSYISQSAAIKNIIANYANYVSDDIIVTDEIDFEN